MTRQIVTQTHQQKPTGALSASGLLQRKCACGNHTMAGGECNSCKKKREQPVAAPYASSSAFNDAPVIQPSAINAQQPSGLTLGKPDDQYEQEADRLAQRVVQLTDVPLHRPTRDIPRLRRQMLDAEDEQAEEGEDEEIAQAKLLSASSQPDRVSPDVTAQINTLRAHGEPLPEEIRAFFEPRLGHDFSRVRVHTDAAEPTAALNAAAFTVGQDIFFGAGQFDTHFKRGRTLLAHELIHTIQQGHAPVRIQREEATARPPARSRTITSRNVTIPWRGSVRASLFVYLRNILRTEAETTRVVDLILNSPTTYFVMAGKHVTREAFDRAPHTNLVLLESMVDVIVRETGYDLAALRLMSDLSQELTSLREGLSGERSLLEGGRSQKSLEGELVRDLGPTTPVSPNWEVLLKNAPLALLYIRFMEHYAAMRLTDEIRSIARDGLSIEELTRITDGNRTYHYFTSMIAQGWREFQSAGGTDIDRYERLQSTILEQFVWGNSTARRNQLEINTGWPERRILGIIERSSGILLYDADGQPLRSFAGGMMRDAGWVGSQPVEEFGININAIEDPVLRGMLNMLRHQVAEPTRVIARAAQIYLDNIEAVNTRVRQGLTQEIIEKFEETLPAFIGFLAGHGLATLLMRSPNPIVAAIGAAVKAGMTGLGYVLQIDFLGKAMDRLFEAANHLVRVRQAQEGRLSELSQNHLELAAVPIRQMVKEVAMSVALGILARLIRGVCTIQCSRCRISRREARARRRQQASRGEGQQVGYTRAQIDALRRAVIRRQRVNAVNQRHRGAERHFQNDADPNILRAINDPQRVFVSRNGSWVFYRNGTVVITRGGYPADVITAYGRGATIPGRHISDFRAGAFGNQPNPNLRVGDPEPPVPLKQWLSAPQQSGDFTPFPIWP